MMAIVWSVYIYYFRAKVCSLLLQMKREPMRLFFADVMNRIENCKCDFVLGVCNVETDCRIPQFFLEFPGIYKDYGVKTYAESEKGVYDDKYEIDDEECKSVMDKEEDPSPYNASSLIILYEPGDGKRLLFAGDANTTSLQMMIDKYKWMRKVDLLKVPHHGSKNNLNTKIIDALAPKKSYISAIGNLKHPNSSVVYWLSKYGDVYSTHKVHNYLHWATLEIENRKGSVTIYPLKKKKVK